MGEPETVIRVENLSKRYVISHAAERGRYSTLRDTLAQGAKSLIRRWTHRGESASSQTREEFWALKDVSFEVKRGDVVGIIGRNGAGKSTLLKVLSRITEPTTGRIAIDGRVASLLEVGTGFHPELTGRENVYLNGSILGMSRVEVKRKFDEIVAFAEIEKFLDTPVKRYSSGMYMRLAFAVAAHLEPEILIVDEVLAVGDAAFQKKCMGKLGEVAQDGRTVLFVSHNLTALSTLCLSGLLLSKGQVLLRGQIEKCISEYVGKYQKKSADDSLAAWDPAAYGVIHLKVRDLETGDEIQTPTLQYPGRYTLDFACNLPSGSSLNLGFTLINSMEMPVLSSSVRDSGLAIEPGTRSLSIELPIGRLPSGDYRIEAAMWDSDKVYFQSDGLLFFTVVNKRSALDLTGSRPRGGTILDTSWQSRELDRSQFESHPSGNPERDNV